MSEWDERYSEIPEPFNRFMQLSGKTEDQTERVFGNREILTKQDLAYVMLIIMLMM